MYFEKKSCKSKMKKKMQTNLLGAKAICKPMIVDCSAAIGEGASH